MEGELDIAAENSFSLETLRWSGGNRARLLHLMFHFIVFQIYAEGSPDVHQDYAIAMKYFKKAAALVWITACVY